MSQSRICAVRRSNLDLVAKTPRLPAYQRCFQSRRRAAIRDSSSNIAASFERAAISSENYYLLYYSPKDYKADGEFKNIKVKIKGKNYSITHRAGYIAN